MNTKKEIHSLVFGPKVVAGDDIDALEIDVPYDCTFRALEIPRSIAESFWLRNLTLFEKYGSGHYTALMDMAASFFCPELHWQETFDLLLKSGMRLKLVVQNEKRTQERFYARVVVERET